MALLSRNPIHVTLCNYDVPACYEADRVRAPGRYRLSSRNGLPGRAAAGAAVIRLVRAGPPPALSTAKVGANGRGCLPAAGEDGLVRAAGPGDQTDQAGCGRSHGGPLRPRPLALRPTGGLLRVPAWFVKLSSVSCVQQMTPADPGEAMFRPPLPGLVVMHARDGGTGR
jgi:hypothetical protein